MQFKNGDLVEIHSTTDTQLDGYIVKVVGVASDFYYPHGGIYIVETPPTLYRGWSAMCLTESCLRKHNEQTTIQ